MAHAPSVMMVCAGPISSMDATALMTTKTRRTDERHDPLLVQSVVKAFNVLKCFDRDQSPLGLTQLMGLLQCDKSTAQRFTHTLQTLGYLEKDPVSKNFVLTVKSLDLGQQYIRSNPLIDRVTPILSQLHRLSTETVNLTILDGSDVVIVARFTSPELPVSSVGVGSRSPAYCTAGGRAILSALPKSRVEAVLAASDLRPYTPNTVWRKEELLGRFERAAARGFETAFEEIFIDDLSIAAPVRNNLGQCVGGMNISVSRHRYAPDEISDRFSTMLMAACKSVAGTANPSQNIMF